MPDVTRVFPVLAVTDLGLALAYYRDRLGFTVAWTSGEPATRAGVTIGAIELHLDAAAGGPAGPAVIYCHMTGVRLYHDACRARGAQITAPLTAQPWGVRDFRVQDPFGNRLGFAEPG